MFDQATGTYLDFSKAELLHLYKSLNQALVSPGPGMVSQPASAMIFVFKNSNSQFEVAVGLHFVDSGQRVLYRVPPFAAEIINEKVAEAEAFVSEMGFLMDNLRFASLSSAERSEIQRKIPFFYREMSLYQEALTSSEREALKAKAETAGHKDAQAEISKHFYDQYLQLMSML